MSLRLDVLCMPLLSKKFYRTVEPAISEMERSQQYAEFMNNDHLIKEMVDTESKLKRIISFARIDLLCM